MERKDKGGVGTKLGADGVILTDDKAKLLNSHLVFISLIRRCL